MQATGRRADPIWDYLESRGVRLSWLAGKIDYAVNHIYAVKAGTHRATERFRRRCSEVLGVPESELFLPSDNETTTPGGESPSVGVRVHGADRKAEDRR